MHKSNEDCFYFLTSSCAKGSSCTYRHSPVALTCNVICPSWLRGNCLDPACPFRHTTAQRPMISNGILCFYENTPTGCLKVDCTFIHSRPRVNLRNVATIRSSSTNLINKDATKPNVSSASPTTTAILQTTSVSNTSINPLQSTPSESHVVIPISTNESSSMIKTESTVRRIAVSSDIDQSKEMQNTLDNNKPSPSLHKSTSRSIITDSPKKSQDETVPPTATIQSRLVVNRNVVLAEATSSPPNRKIVQATSSSSNRVVVSSDSNSSIEKNKKVDIDSVEEENQKKKMKKDSSTTIDIPFPCSTPSITNRMLFMSSKETSSSNNTKPIRLDRNRLPAAKATNGNSPNSDSTSTNEEKTSAGTVLLQDNQRRNMRIERFQKKPNSPPRSIVCSTSKTTMNNGTSNSLSTSRNIVTASNNDRKRAASQMTTKHEPPSKRTSSSLSSNQPSPCQLATSLKISTNSSSSPLSSNQDKRQQKLVDESLRKPIQNKNCSQITTTLPRQHVNSSVHARITSQTIVSPSLEKSSSTTTTTTTTTTKTSRLRQPPAVASKRHLTPMTTSSQTSTKSIEQIPISMNENKSSTSKRSIEPSASNEDDENQLLKPNESNNDFVDAFALIDEALLEADNLLELL